MFKITVFGCLLISCAINFAGEKSPKGSDIYLRDSDGYRVVFMGRKDIRGRRNSLGQLCFKSQEEAVLAKYHGVIFGAHSHVMDWHGQCYVNGKSVTWFEYDLTAAIASQQCVYRVLEAGERKALGLPAFDLKPVGRIKP